MALAGPSVMPKQLNSVDAFAARALEILLENYFVSHIHKTHTNRRQGNGFELAMFVFRAALIHAAA
jgi:hypothetical protein